MKARDLMVQVDALLKADDELKEYIEKIRIVKPGDSITEAGVPIEAVPSYNTNKKFHPKQAGYVGFIITVDGTRIYHAGDTDLIPEMEN
ncbi:MAG TPA: MBL fold metallo-hydrolase, partial [Deltaproteobacteria bacterium]|nr:MBL fold metallo-hydrolase [Deltaproteobacteria bacterium]